MTTDPPPPAARAGVPRAARLVRRIAWTLASTLLAAGAAQAAGVYQWKDAQGNTHFTDTPPPAGTTQAAAAKPAAAPRAGAGLTEARRLALRERFNSACRAGAESPACLQARREVSLELQKDCAPRHSREFCAQDMDAIARDLAQDIADELPKTVPAEAARKAVRTAPAARTEAHDCTVKRETVARHKARLQASAGLTPEQHAQQSSLIGAIEAELDALGCP